MLPAMDNFYLECLEQHKNKGLWRIRDSDRFMQTDKENWLDFRSNNYLNLAQHAALITALAEGAQKYGVGSSASPLLGGYHQPHAQLEKNLAQFFGFEAALTFSCGYLANRAVITSLIRENDLVFEHHQNHASLIDAVSSTKAKRYRYRNYDHLVALCQKYSDRPKWIISDGVFSMDGQIAELVELVKLSKLYKAHLMLDDAHGIGVLGKNGRGSLEQQQIKPQDITILTGTFGKALGSQGAFVLGKNFIIENIVQFGRPYIYSTALSPAIAHANCQSLKIMAAYQHERCHLQNLIQFFQKTAAQLNIAVIKSCTPIQTLIIGDIFQATHIVKKLRQKKILVGLIRPPTIPPNTTRLRINLTLKHSFLDIQHLLEALHEILKATN